jgi:alkylated DNA repair protein alkB homolog 6
MPHEDGGAYNPVVATVSLGGTVVLDLYSKDVDERQERNGKPLHRILQEPRSLLVTKGEAYTALLHGIEGLHQDDDLNSQTIANWSLLGDTKKYDSGLSIRGVRTSLTFRDVLRVSHGARNILGTSRK